MDISCFCTSLDTDFTSIGCGLNLLIAGDLGGNVGSCLFTASKSLSSFCFRVGGVCSGAFLNKEELFSFAVSLMGGLLLISSSFLVFVRAPALSGTAEGSDVFDEAENVLSLSG